MMYIKEDFCGLNDTMCMKKNRETMKERERASERARTLFFLHGKSCLSLVILKIYFFHIYYT